MSPSDRAEINRQNAQKSTGPVTEEGKHHSAVNAVKHGLTGQTVMLDSDDADAYQYALEQHIAQFNPVTFEERRLVQSVHDCAWRLNRILNMESTIFAKGRMELQYCFYELPVEQRKSFIELETAERNAKQLRNLHIQEARIQKQRAKDLVALNKLVADRKAEEAAATDSAATSKTSAHETGFVFEKPQSASQTTPATTTEDRDRAA